MRLNFQLLRRKWRPREVAFTFVWASPPLTIPYQEEMEMQRAFSYARKIAQKRYSLDLKDAGTISVELPDGIYPGIPWIVGVG